MFLIVEVCVVESLDQGRHGPRIADLAKRLDRIAAQVFVCVHNHLQQRLDISVTRRVGKRSTARVVIFRPQLSQR